MFVLNPGDMALRGRSPLLAMQLDGDEQSVCDVLANRLHNALKKVGWEDQHFGWWAQANYSEFGLVLYLMDVGVRVRWGPLYFGRPAEGSSADLTLWVRGEEREINVRSVKHRDLQDKDAVPYPAQRKEKLPGCLIACSVAWEEPEGTRLAYWGALERRRLSSIWDGLPQLTGIKNPYVLIPLADFDQNVLRSLLEGADRVEG